jgi:3-hydroxymyristoyl/3-hydroxydecanoyl-(acyl carrier protein) dehydratase
MNTYRFLPTKKTDKINKIFVHKHNEENVFVSKIVQNTDNKFTVFSTIDTEHSVYNDYSSGLNASMYIIELGRQANMAICHRYFNVGFKTKFVVLEIKLVSEGNRPFIQTTLEAWQINIDFVMKKTLAGRTWYKTKAVFFQGDKAFMIGYTRFFHNSKSIDEDHTGSNSYSHQSNVVLSEIFDYLQISNPDNILITYPEQSQGNGSFQAKMCVNPEHQYFFEHPNPHVPGMMLLEAGKQLSLCSLKMRHDNLAQMYGDIIRVTVRFKKFAAFQPEIQLVAKAEKPETRADCVIVFSSINFFQNGERLGNIECTTSFVQTHGVMSSSTFSNS